MPATAKSQSLRPDALVHLLATIPADVWAKNWCDNSTIVLRCASKTLCELVDAMYLPTVANMSSIFWLEGAGPSNAKWTFVLNRILTLTVRSRITSLGLLCASYKLFGLRSVLPLCPHLQRLHISSNGNVGPMGVVIIAQALPSCTGLTHLDLCSNDMCADGLFALLPTLRTCAGLRHFDLGLDGLQDTGVTALAPVLTTCHALALLNLSGNAVQAGGVTVLSVFLHQVSTLTHLDLGHNELGNTVATYIAPGLARCQRLQHVDLSNNRCLCFSLLSVHCTKRSCACRNILTQFYRFFNLSMFLTGLILLLMISLDMELTLQDHRRFKHAKDVPPEAVIQFLKPSMLPNSSTP
jgi:hypothetical protein